MKIFAYNVSAVDMKGAGINGMRIEVGIDGYEVEKKVIKDVEGVPGVRLGSVKINRKISMSMERLCYEMRPHLDKLVKNSQVKSDLLDLIGKLPVDL